MLVALAAVACTIVFGALAARAFGLSRDLVFTVMGVNFISTITMVICPALDQLLGFSPLEMGAFLGGSIHDVAQVAGAGQTLGPDVPTDAILTKLLRVAMLLPAVVGIAWWLARTGEKSRDARPSPPVFLFGFLALAALNSMGLVPAGAKTALSELSSFLIILAIGALGMRTSLLALARIGTAPVMLLLAETVFVGVLVTGVIHALKVGFG